MRIGIITLNGGLEVNIPDPSLSSPLGFEFLAVFGKIDIATKTVRIEPIHVWSNDLKTNVLQYISRHKSKNSGLFKLIQLLNGLSKDEKFLMFHSEGVKLSKAEQHDVFVTLMILNGHSRSAEDHLQSKKDIDQISENYEIIVVKSNGKNMRIGENEKGKRQCIYCDKRISDGVTFNTKAHAISESLGNKHIIQTEECDGCNNNFGKYLEPNLANYLAPFRVFYQVKGKGGTPKYKQGGNTFLENESGRVIVKSEHYVNKDDNVPDTILLKFEEKIQLNNIYKSMVKYLISCLGRTHIDKLSGTIKWLNDFQSQEVKLPKIGTIINYNMYTEDPYMVIYKRISGNTKLPFLVGELKFMAMTFSFIAPFIDGEETDFSDEGAFKDYWNTMPHYNQFNNWSFSNFSMAVPKKFEYELKMEKSNDAP